MRKIAVILLLLLTISLIPLSLAGCESHKLERGITDTTRYQAENKKDLPQLQYYYEKQNNKIGVFYLGRIKNVPLCSTDAYEHGSLAFNNIIFTEKNFNEENFNFAKSNAISEIISNDVNKTLSYVDASGNNVNIAVASNATIDYRYNVCEVLKSGDHKSGSYSFIDSFAYAKEFVNQKNMSALSYKVGMFANQSFFRISLLGSCDFYAFTAYNGETNVLSVTYDLSVVKDSLFFGWEESADQYFKANNDNKCSLIFKPSVLSDGLLFDKQTRYSITYVLSGGKFDGEPNQSYTISSVNLSTPTLEHFLFDGWYFDDSLTNPATEDAVKQKACDLTLYAKWKTETDVVTWSGFTGLTSNIKGDETGKINTAKVSNDKLQAYIFAGYKARITFYYTAGVPLEYEGTSDSSDLKIQLGLSKDTTDSTFISKNEHYHAGVANGTSFSKSLSFETSLSDLQTYHVAVRLIILSNDTAVLGICGKDAGTYSNLKMVIEYVK